MTIASTTRKTTPAVGNGVATSFPFAFKVFAKADLQVNTTVISTGVSTTRVLDSDYAVILNADQDNNPGGSVTYPLTGSPMDATTELQIVSNVTMTQNLRLPAGGGSFNAKVIEDSLDKALIGVQQLIELGSRALTFPPIDSNPGQIPSAVTRALKVLGFDAAGNPIATQPSSALVSSAMTPVVAAATLAAARIAMGMNEQILWCGTAGGTANALTVTPVNAAEALVAGLTLVFKSGAAVNTGATTLQPTGLAISAIQAAGAACVGGEIQPNQWYEAVYDGAAFQITQLAPSVPLSTFTTKGDIVTATAAGKVARKGVGAAGSLIMARPADTSGLAYVAALNKAIYGLTYANNAGDAVNDLDIAAGGCMDATGAYWITVAALTKQSDVVWAVGNNAGGLDTGVVGNNDYYIWAIARSDTGVTDILYSLSSTAPTMPGSYDFKRLIGWFKRVAGTIVAFTVTEIEGGGIEHVWSTPTTDINLPNTLTTARRTDPLKVPLTFAVSARIHVVVYDGTVPGDAQIYCADQTDGGAPGGSGAPLANFDWTVAKSAIQQIEIRTSATGTIAARATVATVDVYVASTMSFRWARRN